MKSFLLSALLVLSFLSSQAQNADSRPDIIIQMPPYQQGKYECDTIFKHYGGAGGNSKASIAFSNNTLSTSLMTGVKFYVLVDSIEPGLAPLPSAFIDSLGVKVPMRKGGKYEIPTKMEVHGKIRFYVLLAGTPTIESESYFCNLWLSVPLIEDNVSWDMKINKGSEKICKVIPLMNIEDASNDRLLAAYPNPVNDKVTIKVSKQLLHSEYTLMSTAGKKIASGYLTSEFTTLNLETLPAGNYILQIGKEAKQTLKIIKQ